MLAIVSIRALSTNVDLAICTGKDGVFEYNVVLSEKVLGTEGKVEVVVVSVKLLGLSTECVVVVVSEKMLVLPRLIGSCRIESCFGSATNSLVW